MATILGRHWPLAVCLVILWLAIATVLVASLALTDGHVVYALDDPYIHMAMAKNLAQHGVLGVTRYEVTSTTSAPLWTLLLALLFAVFGNDNEIPLLVNMMLATGVVVVAYRVINATRVTGGGSSSNLVTCGILLSLIFFTPLPALVVSGTEHVLQTLLCLAFAGIVVRVAAASTATVPGFGWLYVLAPLATAARYEALFLVVPAALLLVARQRARQALIVVVVACIPGLLYGAFSASQGWSWLPNSLLVKGAFPRHVDSISSLAVYLSRWLKQLLHSPPLFAASIAAGAAAVVARNHNLPARRTDNLAQAEMVAEGPYLVLLFAGAALLHLQLANIGSFYRYEAYLIAVAVLGAGTCVASALGNRPAGSQSRWPRSAAARAAAVVAILLLLVPLGGRALAGMVNTARATRNIYQQQVQMGRFLQRFYTGQSVAINDIGAVNYLADVHGLDLWGLADRQISQLRRADRYSTEDIRKLARTHGVVIAVVYESGFAAAGGLPREWIKVGEWEIADNFICGAATVSFWAVDPSVGPRLRLELESFAGELPHGVVVRSF